MNLRKDHCTHAIVANPRENFIIVPSSAHFRLRTGSEAQKFSPALTGGGSTFLGSLLPPCAMHNTFHMTESIYNTMMPDLDENRTYFY